MKKFARLAVTSLLLVGMLGIGAVPASASHYGLADPGVIVLGTAELNAGLWLFGAGPPVSTTGPANNVSGAVFPKSGQVPTDVTAVVTGHLVHADVPGGPVVHQHVNALLPLWDPGSNAGGWAGHSLGSVTVTFAAGSHTGTWVSFGTQLVLTGGVTGSVNAVVDVTHPHGAAPHPLLNPPFVGPGNSTLNGTAHHFLVDGAVVLV